MKLTIEKDNLIYLTKSIEVLSDMIGDGFFRLTKEGMSIIEMDESNIAMAALVLPPTLFSNYSFEGEQEVTWGLKLSELMKGILKKIKSTDKVIFDDELVKGRLYVTAEGKMTKRVSFSLVEEPPNHHRHKLQEFQKFEKHIVLPPSLLAEAFSDLDEFDAYVSVGTVGKEKVCFGAEGINNKAEIFADADVKITGQNGDSVSKFKNSFLQIFTKKACLELAGDTKATLDIGTDYPMVMKYDVPDKMKLTFVIAPRVAND